MKNPSARPGGGNNQLRQRGARPQNRGTTEQRFLEGNLERQVPRGVARYCNGPAQRQSVHGLRRYGSWRTVSLLGQKTKPKSGFELRNFWNSSRGPRSSIRDSPVWQGMFEICLDAKLGRSINNQ